MEVDELASPARKKKKTGPRFFVDGVSKGIVESLVVNAIEKARKRAGIAPELKKTVSSTERAGTRVTVEFQDPAIGEAVWKAVKKVHVRDDSLTLHLSQCVEESDCVTTVEESDDEGNGSVQVLEVRSSPSIENTDTDHREVIRLFSDLSPFKTPRRSLMTQCGVHPSVSDCDKVIDAAGLKELSDCDETLDAAGVKELSDGDETFDAAGVKELDDGGSGNAHKQEGDTSPVIHNTATDPFEADRHFSHMSSSKNPVRRSLTPLAEPSPTDTHDDTEETCFVKFEKVPQNYKEVDFLCLIWRKLGNARILNTPLSVLSREQDTVVVEFPDTHMATKVGAWKSFVYNGRILMLSLYHADKLQSPALNENMQHLLVKYSNFPSTFDEADFLNQLEFYLMDLEILTADDTLSIEKTGDASGLAVVVKFPDAVKAKAAAELDCFLYGDRILTTSTFIVQEGDDFFGGPVCLSSTRIDDVQVPGPQASGLSRQSSVESVDRLPVIPAGARTRTDWPTLETLKFLKACLLNRELLRNRSTQEQGKGWRNVIKLMYDEELFYTDRNLKKRLRILITTFEVEDEQWPFKQFIAKYLGDEEGKADTAAIDQAISNASRPPRQEMPAPMTGGRAALAEANKQICGIYVMDDNVADELGAKFDYAKTLLLISEYDKRRPRFADNKSRSSALYQEIADKFRQYGYATITAEDCSKRMAFLAQKYKSLHDQITRLTGSGAEPTQWIYFDAMGQLLEKSVLVEPRRLMAFGSSVSHTVRVGPSYEGGSSSHSYSRVQVAQENRGGRKKSATHHDDSNKKKKKKKKKKKSKKKSNSSQISLSQYRSMKLEMQKKFLNTTDKIARMAANNSSSSSSTSSEDSDEE